jgi:hypothetical protein
MKRYSKMILSWKEYFKMKDHFDSRIKKIVCSFSRALIFVTQLAIPVHFKTSILNFDEH